ncbi:MAG: carbohydrate ABC transporter permease [Anaerolineales bacterium]
MSNQALASRRLRSTEPALVRQRVLHIIGRVILYAVLAAGAFIFSLPFFWMLSASVKPEYLVYNVPVVWLPPRGEWHWERYINSWNVLTVPFTTFYKNTAIITVTNIIGLVLSTSMVAFAFARIRFWGRDTLFLILLATMMLPEQVTLIPLYLIWSRLGAVNTFWPLIVPEWLSNAYNVFLLRQFMMTIPLEMDDAARIDGAGWFRIYWQIVMPMSKAALGVIAIQAFQWNWNNFLGPLIYLNTPPKFTIAIGLRLFQTQQSEKMPETMAMSVVAMLPCLLMFFFAQRYFIQGIVISGVKG